MLRLESWWCCVFCGDLISPPFRPRILGGMEGGWRWRRIRGISMGLDNACIRRGGLDPFCRICQPR